MRASGWPSAALQHRCFAMLLDAFQLTCKQLSAGLWGGWFLRLNGVQNGSKMSAKWLIGGLLELLGLLQASWSGLGGLLERFWTALGPRQIHLERLLATPRGIPREVSAILRAKRPK